MFRCKIYYNWNEVWIATSLHHQIIVIASESHKLVGSYLFFCVMWQWTHVLLLGAILSYWWQWWYTTIYISPYSVGEESVCEEKWGFKRSDRSLLVFSQTEIQATKHGTSEEIPEGPGRNQRRWEKGQRDDGQLLKHILLMADDRIWILSQWEEKDEMKKIVFLLHFNFNW